MHHHPVHRSERPFLGLSCSILELIGEWKQLMIWGWKEECNTTAFLCGISIVTDDHDSACYYRPAVSVGTPRHNEVNDQDDHGRLLSIMMA